MTLDGKPEWVKSSLSFANGNSVEVADLEGGWVGVRDSKDPNGPVLRFDADEWHAFIGGAKKGDFDWWSGSRRSGRPVTEGDPAS